MFSNSATIKNGVLYLDIEIEASDCIGKIIVETISGGIGEDLEIYGNVNLITRVGISPEDVSFYSFTSSLNPIIDNVTANIIFTLNSDPNPIIAKDNIPLPTNIKSFSDSSIIIGGKPINYKILTPCDTSTNEC